MGNTVTWAELHFRHADPTSNYAVRLVADTGGGSGPVELINCVRGKRLVVAHDTYSTGSAPYSVKVSVTADNDIDDGGDHLVVSNSFGSTSITPTYDDNDNLTYDGSFRYTPTMAGSCALNPHIPPGRGREVIARSTRARSASRA